MHDKNIEGIKDIQGLWMVNLKVPSGVEIRILFDISTNLDGSKAVTMDNLDQGASGIPVETVTYKDDNLILEVNSVSGVFEGTLKKGGKIIKGKWKQARSIFPLVLNRVNKAPDLRRNRILQNLIFMMKKKLFMEIKKQESNCQGL
jgi:uncharacterized protein